MLEHMYKNKHQVLIFSEMTALLNVLEDYLLWRGWNYCRIDGSIKIDDWQREMDLFITEYFGENPSRFFFNQGRTNEWTIETKIRNCNSYILSTQNIALSESTKI